MKAPLFFLLVCVLMGTFLIGGFAFSGLSKPTFVPTAANACCESGDGDACKPQTGTGQTLTYNGAQYGLIKAKVDLIEGNAHLEDSGQTVNGNPIIVNSSNIDNTTHDPYTTAGYLQYCNQTQNEDAYFNKVPADQDKQYLNKGVPNDIFVRLLQSYCTPVPNDELVFVCKQNCHPATCTTDAGEHCYGDENSVYDVYYRTSDFASKGIPDFIKNCDKSHPLASSGINVVGVTPGPQRKNLQLETLGLTANSLNPGLSPFCKPAIYLYPPKTTQVHVAVNPVGPISYSEPSYPANGWDVTANPNGAITAGNKQLDYLYYEAEIPDTKIEKPSSGFVVKTAEVKNLLTGLLPKLGLNSHEQQQFIDYWTSKLPASPYYFVGVVSQTNLNAIAPLSISPVPDSTIRVTLYFEALDSFKQIDPPVFSPVVRDGFTVVEWGGIIKLHPGTPFTCLM